MNINYFVYLINYIHAFWFILSKNCNYCLIFCKLKYFPIAILVAKALFSLIFQAEFLVRTHLLSHSSDFFQNRLDIGIKHFSPFLKLIKTLAPSLLTVSQLLYFLFEHYLLKILFDFFFACESLFLPNVPSSLNGVL